MNTNIAVKVEELNKSFGPKTVLTDMSFELAVGECLGVFGMRGSGKTTLIHILAGIEPFSAGRAEVLGCSLNERNYAYRSRMGLVTQAPSLFNDLTVLENMDYLAVLKGCGKEQIEPLGQRLQLKPYFKEAAGRLDVSIYQRLSLACALLNQPEILFIDDITKDIDLASLKIILREIREFRENGGTCVWGFSNMYYHQWMDRIVWLEEGRMVLFSPQEAQRRWDKMESEIIEG